MIYASLQKIKEHQVSTTKAVFITISRNINTQTHDLARAYLSSGDVFHLNSYIQDFFYLTNEILSFQRKNKKQL